MATNDLDALMDTDPDKLTKDDLDAIILYHRKKRAEREAGGTKRATRDTGEKVNLDQLVKNIANVAAAPAVIVKRRI